MAVTMEQVRAVLDPEETDYEQGRALGAEALPHLEALVRTGDPMLASKAAYLAGLLAQPGSAGVLAQAAASDEPTVRVAAAAAARHLAATDSEGVLVTLLSDDDPGVRRVALNSVPPSPTPELRSKVEDLTGAEPDEVVRQLSEQVLQRLGGGGATQGLAAPAEMPGAAAGGAPGGAPGGAGEMPGAPPEGAVAMPEPAAGGEVAEMPGAVGGAGEAPSSSQGLMGGGEMPGAPDAGGGAATGGGMPEGSPGQGEMPGA